MNNKINKVSLQNHVDVKEHMKERVTRNHWTTCIGKMRALKPRQSQTHVGGAAQITDKMTETLFAERFYPSLYRSCESPS